MNNIALTGNSSWSILNFRKNLISRLIQNGSKVHILAPVDSSSKELGDMGCLIHNIKIDRRGLNPFKDIKLIIRYYILLRKYKISHICTFNIKPNLYVAYACFFLDTKPIINISGLGSAFIGNNFLTKIAKLLYKIALYGPNKTVFFQNKSDLNFFKESKIYFSESSNILPGSGIDLNFFKKNNAHLEERELITKISYIGRLINDKGIMEFLNAAHHISKKNENVQFNIYGDFDLNNPSNSNRQNIESYFSDKIKFRGQVKDIRDALKRSHCVILPSYREGMSRSLLEAAASGIPIIATDVPGCREIVSNEINGYLCNARDTDDLIVKIDKFLKLSNAELKRFGDNARIKIENEFSVEIVIKKYLEQIY